LSDSDSTVIPEEQESTEAVASEPKVIYVKERPFRKLFVNSIIVLAVGFALIYVVSFVGALAGIRVPYVDHGAMGNQLDNVLGNERDPSAWNELERNP
jgi:hypothetical protein